MNPENVNRFIVRLAEIVPSASLIHKQPELREYAAGPDTPLAVVFPEDTEQLKQIVRAAGELGIPLVPVSSGPVHTHTGPRDGKDRVVVDFSRMNKIRKLDAVGRYAWIESGVTFGELIPALKKHGLTA